MHLLEFLLGAGGPGWGEPEGQVEGGRRASWSVLFSGEVHDLFST